MCAFAGNRQAIMPEIREPSWQSICLVRLSAIGDVVHTIAVVRALQDAFPAARLTWVVGGVEAALAALVPGVEVVPVDKRRPFTELRRLRREWRGRRFDALLHLQVAIRASVLTLAVRAPVRVGFDRARAKELHGWFVNRRIPAAALPGEHVLDGLLRFPAALGAPVGRPRWDLELPARDEAWAADLLPAGAPIVALNACSSHAGRDWPVERFAALRDSARLRGWRVVLCGGSSAREQAAAAQLRAPGDPGVIDLIGRTTLPRLACVLARCAALVSPDSGPVHLATAVGTPVVGLYAVSNLRRTGPYLDRRWSVDRRDEAARRFLGRSAATLGWRERVAHPGAMQLITVENVTERLEAALADRRT